MGKRFCFVAPTHWGLVIAKPHRHRLSTLSDHFMTCISKVWRKLDNDNVIFATIFTSQAGENAEFTQVLQEI